MKKLISVLLTVCAIAANTNVLAADVTSTITGSQNGKNSLVADSTQTTEMPCFKSGEVLKFDVSKLTPGNQLTLISYKASADDLSNNTVQYINQYTLGDDEDTKPIEYKIRDIEDGIYKIVLNGNDGNAVATFYYKVGESTVAMVAATDGTKYHLAQEFGPDGSKTYSIAFIASAKLDSSELTFADTGVETLGMQFTANGKTITSSELSSEKIEAAANTVETDGTVTLYYGLTMYNVTDINAANSITVVPTKNGVAIQEKGGNAE